jgi:ribosome-binding factor A
MRGRTVLAGKRSDRVGEQLFKEIAQLIEHMVKDPRVRVVTVTGVDLSTDLKFAKVYYSVFDEEKTLEDAEKGLLSAKGYIKREIGRRMGLRYVPDLVFMHDTSLKRGVEMEKLLDSLNLDETSAEDEE